MPTLWRKYRTMKFFFASLHDRSFVNVEKAMFVLESFYYIKDWEIPLIHKWNDFLLDSGAFTFMSKVNRNVNWDKYVEDYASFINKYDIKKFFELDIDCIVGIKEVERLRNKLECLTKKKCIPVWHKSRGKKYWFEMCNKYPYVAIGGIVTKEIKPNEYCYLNWFINEAHKRGAKVHGLGFTSMRYLNKIKFDSVDSTNWKSGGLFGQLHIYKNKIIKSLSFKNKRAKDYKQIDKFNFLEWVKFQKYAEKNL